MVPRYSRNRLLYSTLQVGLLRRFAMQLLHQRPRLEPVLPIDDDVLATLKAGIDEGLPLADLCNGNRPHLYRAIGPDHVDIRAVWTLLHRRGGDRRSVVAGLKK